MRATPIPITWTPELSVYASEPFLKAVGDEYGWLGGTDNSGRLRCILPFTIVRKATLRMVRFRVETIPLDDAFGVKEETKFLNCAVDYFRSVKADIIIPATTNAIFRAYPRGAVAAPYGTLVIDLDKPEEILWGRLHSKHRNVIRSATKKEVQIRSGPEYAETAYRLVVETFARSRLAFMGRGAFMDMISALGPRVRVFIADCQGTVQGCAVIPFSNHSAYYVYGGSTPQPVTGAMNLMQWEAIRYFRELGVRHYDFCGVRINPDRGSKQAGLLMFKERFGPRLVQGYMWKYALNPVKAGIYSVAVRMSRGGDIVDAERHKLDSSTRNPDTINVILIHGGVIPHYRVPVYGYLSSYLERYGYELAVLSDGIQPENPYPVEFRHTGMRLSAASIARYVLRHRPAIIIDYMELRHRYLFPTYLITKGLLGCKLIYWGQGRDLLDPHNRKKNLAYAAEQSMCAAIVLYAEHLRKYVPTRFHKKTFTANNTLALSYAGLPRGVTRDGVLARYGIRTTRNIICVGRMQKRKRIEHLAEALAMMNRPDIGLILVGPDTEGALDQVSGQNVYKLGPIYGDKKFDLLSAADVCCLPGAVGLGIVDAFHCGLPFVTEEGEESAEIMYLKDGVNGFIVPRGSISKLSEKLRLLLDDDELRRSFSVAAKREIAETGSMDKFCSGSREALSYATTGTAGSSPNPK